MTFSRINFINERRFTILSWCFLEQTFFEFFLFFCCRECVIIVLKQNNKLHKQREKKSSWSFFVRIFYKKGECWWMWTEWVGGKTSFLCSTSLMAEWEFIWQIMHDYYKDFNGSACYSGSRRRERDWAYYEERLNIKIAHKYIKEIKGFLFWETKTWKHFGFSVS